MLIVKIEYSHAGDKTTHIIPLRFADSTAIHLGIIIAPALMKHERRDAIRTPASFPGFEASG
jgi:hypothetical protein